MSILKPHCLSTLDTVALKNHWWICIFFRCLWSWSRTFQRWEQRGCSLDLISWRTDAARISGWGDGKWPESALSPTTRAQNFHPLCSRWVWNADYVQFCQSKSFSLQGINFMRTLSLIQALSLYFIHKVADGSMSASSIRGDNCRQWLTT